MASANYYRTIYVIHEKDESLNLLMEKDHGKKEYYIHRRIFELAVNSFVVTSEKWFDVEIDAEQKETLLKDITTKFLTKSLKSRRVEKKIGHAFEICNLFRTIRLFKEIVFRW